MAGEMIMTQRKSTREQKMASIAAAKSLDEKITAAMTDYPQLCGWRLRREAIKRTGPGEDHWIWTDDVRLKAKRAEYFLSNAVQFAAARISEAYGLGVGTEWAQKHFGVYGDEAKAETQVLAIMSSLDNCSPDK
jgi:hypothetical protein